MGQRGTRPRHANHTATIGSRCAQRESVREFPANQTI